MSLLLSLRTPGRALLCAAAFGGVVALSGCAGSPPDGLSAYDSDPAIAARVQQAVSADAANAAALKDGRIRIHVLQGSVTLVGNADSVTQMANALAAVRTVGGVQSVQSDLHLRSVASPRTATSSSISESAKTGSPKPSRSE